MKRKCLIFLLFLWQAVLIYAQERTVSGVVTDEFGEPLIGATVLIKGTSRGVITDIDGKYLHTHVQDGAILQVSYIGYDTKEIVVHGNILNVTLENATTQLDDIIVVAYGTASKAGYTGSASTVKKEAIANAQVSSISRLLQGAASGVQAVSSSGQPGSDASIYIRGIGSVNASSNPLYIVDGAPYEGDLNSINPADIESLSVMKDAASTALYGARAANGLIIITTKQGVRAEKPRIDASFKYGISSRAVSDYNKIGTNDYFELYWEALRNQEYYVEGASWESAAQTASRNLVSSLGINPYGSTYPNPVGTDGKLVAGATPLWDDDWTKEYTQNAHRTEAQVNISGGGAKNNYYVSLGYLDDQGIAIASGFKRYTGRVNLNSDLKPWLRITTGIALTHSVQDAPQSEDSNLANTLNFARMIPNFYPIWLRDTETGQYVDENGNVVSKEDRVIDYGRYRPSGANPKYNHLGSSRYDFNKRTRDMASLRGAVEIDLLPGLTYRGSLNIDYTNRINHSYTNPVYGASADNDSPGSVSKYNYRTTGFTGNNILTYTFRLAGKHDFKILAGQEYYEYNNGYFGGVRNGFPGLGFYEPVAASELSSFTGQSEQYKLLSYFGNIEYNFSHKYYGSVSLRRDGSSRFSPESRWGTFWSLGASWRISEEEAVQAIPWISRLTLRASYGGQGNDNLLLYYGYQALYTIKNNLGDTGFVSSTISNPDLKWETNLNLNIGIDFGLFDNRLTGSVEYFNRRTKDLLFQIPKPLSTGFSGYNANTGALKNEGVEISLSGTVLKTKDLSWDIFANATHYKNKITSLPQGEIISGNKLLRVGGSIYDFFLVEWAGIEESTGLPQWYKSNKDGTREKTTVYTQANNTDSKIIAGSSLPDLAGGFGTNLTYKGFELSALFNYTLGGKIYNGDKTGILHNGSTAGRAMSTDMLDRWTPENRHTDVPRLQTSNSSAWTSTSTRFLVNADYLRLKNLTFGYNFPRRLIQQAGIENLKLYIQGENLLTVFGEQGMDPEQTVSGGTYYRYPQMKTFSFGVNISF
ncbi:MAG: TonB-dependent receptor [Tannerellaceae bacterium]|nr:TonB-dependent receptor [Tannerellaceae bacterium]